MFLVTYYKVSTKQICNYASWSEIFSKVYRTTSTISEKFDCTVLYMNIFCLY